MAKFDQRFFKDQGQKTLSELRNFVSFKQVQYRPNIKGIAVDPNN